MGDKQMKAFNKSFLCFILQPSSINVMLLLYLVIEHYNINQGKSYKLVYLLSSRTMVL
jgi:hypothetical protein